MRKLDFCENKGADFYLLSLAEKQSPILPQVAVMIADCRVENSDIEGASSRLSVMLPRFTSL